MLLLCSLCPIRTRRGRSLHRRKLHNLLAYWRPIAFPLVRGGHGRAEKSPAQVFSGLALLQE